MQSSGGHPDTASSRASRQAASLPAAAIGQGILAPQAIVRRFRSDGLFRGQRGGKGIAWRTHVIYETNLITSYAAGRYAQLKEGGYEWWIYKHSDFVQRPRPHHVALDGITKPADDPFWREYHPPNGWGCRCRALGARGPATIRRAGGDPDKRLPEWVGKIDPQTQAPVGIDKGFAYAPGASVVEQTRRAVAEKVTKLPKQLARPLAEEAKLQPPSYQEDVNRWNDAAFSARQ